MDIKKFFTTISAKPNDPQTERDFRETCLLYENHCSASNQPLSQDYQQYLNLYHNKTSLYLYIPKEDANKISLTIYDTESEKEQERTFDLPKPIEFARCIIQLPNGDLFIFDNSRYLLLTLINDQSYRIKALPSGPDFNCLTAIYFKNNVYCFGGHNRNNKIRTASSKFDLTENRWNHLTPLPRIELTYNIIIFNGNILISGLNINLLLYSVDIDSFSEIPYNFADSRKKILINIERLFLIECGYFGLIYESEDEYNWKIISKSIIKYNHFQEYCIYNKGGIYIGIKLKVAKYFKFDLNQKNLIKLNPKKSLLGVFELFNS